MSANGEAAYRFVEAFNRRDVETSARTGST